MATILVCKEFPILDKYGESTNKKELLVDYAIDSDTLKAVIVPCVSPWELGAKFNHIVGEWIL